MTRLSLISYNTQRNTKEGLFFNHLPIELSITVEYFQPALTCSKLTMETLEQRCEICSKLTIILLTLNIFHTFVLVLLFLTLNMQLPTGLMQTFTTSINSGYPAPTPARTILVDVICIYSLGDLELNGVIKLCNDDYLI